MASKPNKQPKGSKDSSPKEGKVKETGKAKKPLEDDDNDDSLDDDTPVSKKPVSSAKKNVDDDDDDDDIAPEEEVDEWEKVEDDDDNWDPDFDEFDVPKSKSGKKVPGAKKGGDEDDDFKIDEEFKDMLGGSSKGFDDEDDDF